MGTITPSTDRRAGMNTLLAVLLTALLVACGGILSRPRQGWNPSLGPVVPHDSFPTDCTLCHTGKDWHTIKEDFKFDHQKETGVALAGAHAKAACLLCHNDRGPAGQFAANGCAGCHEDRHQGRLGRNCQDCHAEQDWIPRDMIARHNRTRFPLVGNHAGAACWRCHPGAQAGNFQAVDDTCANCHQADLARATVPDHAAQGWTSDCQRCHTPAGAWEQASFEHPGTFPLTAGHAGVACTTCHSTGTFRGTSTACASCHMPDYQRTTAPNHAAAGFSTSCNQCHNTAGWTGANFIHTSRFALTNAHAGRSCTDCHTGGVYSGLSSDCVSCHRTDYQGTTNPNHVTSGFQTNCTQCHTTVAWSPANFSHSARFPLTAGHSGLSCTQCHTGGTYTAVSTACNTCHMPDYQGTTNPNHAAAGFSTNCTQCHNTGGWTGVNFVHTSSFPLTNGHAGQQCTACHTGSGTYSGLSTACASCHQDRFTASTNPSHTQAGFATTCNTCHSTVAWQPSTYGHIARFPLTGGHAGQTCNECHSGGVYRGLPATCASCHQAQYNATANPNHQQLGYSTTCNQCHTTATWLNATVSHPATFPLTSGHSNVRCNTCHTSGVYTGLSTTCSSCHQNRFTASTNPNHAQAGFNTTCNTCHSTVAWQPSRNWTHVSRFPLSGGHGGQTCNACHASGTYVGLNSACVSCHQSNYNATTNPNHTTAGYSTNCTQCHSTTTWQGASVTHPATFPLTNGHGGVACNTCHTSGVYTGLSTTCSSCHTPEYQASTNPRHAQAGFNTTCTTCHTTVAWQPSRNWTHVSRFPLSGGHGGQTCNACHASGTYVGLNSACVSCHQSNYNATTNPNHTTAGYSTTCNQCHTTTTWLGASVTHPATFPLTNGHAGQQCAACHTGGVYTGLSTACSSCHTTEYQATTNPRHTQASFNTTCNTCHTTVAWRPSVNWTHVSRFPLTNGHAGQTCNACHASGTYVGLNSACVSCHQADYNATANPNHTSAGFGTGCVQCHNTTTWQGATFNHTPFVITSGAHRSPQIIACTRCHTTGQYSQFSCTTNCHAQNATNSNHREVNNYVYASANCYACHPQGRH